MPGLSLGPNSQLDLCPFRILSFFTNELVRSATVLASEGHEVGLALASLMGSSEARLPKEVGNDNRAEVKNDGFGSQAAVEDRAKQVRCTHDSRRARHSICFGSGPNPDVRRRNLSNKA
jgi:hypothetical protein